MNECHGTVVQTFVAGTWWVLLRRVGYSCISSSLNCALRCVGTCWAKTSGVDLHSEVVQPWSFVAQCLEDTETGIHFLYWRDVI